MKKDKRKVIIMSSLGAGESTSIYTAILDRIKESDNIISVDNINDFILKKEPYYSPGKEVFPLINYFHEISNSSNARSAGNCKRGHTYIKKEDDTGNVFHECKCGKKLWS
jgi:hypothetical protein